MIKTKKIDLLMGDPIASRVDHILSSFRLLEFSKIQSHFDEIERLLTGNILDEQLSNRIALSMLPIFYPGDTSSYRLKFSIQCLSSCYLLKMAPNLRLDILTSVMDIFQQFPHVFIGKSAIRTVLNTFFESVDNSPEIFNQAIADRSYDFIWCFFLYCYDNIESAKHITNWELISHLLSNESLYQSRKIMEILSFLEKSCYTWGPNSMVSSALANQSFNFAIHENDIPPFIYDPNSYAITREEKTILAIALHISQPVPQTARTLSIITRQSDQFQSPLYLISLFLALLQNAPSNYKKALAQKVQSISEKVAFSERVAAHIVAAVSVSQIANFSLIGTFSNSFGSNEYKRSIFFAHLADCCQFFDMNSTVYFITTALNSISNCSYEGICNCCKFISSLLNKCRLQPDVLTQEDLEHFSQAVPILINIVTQKCEEQTATIETIGVLVDLAAKILAKISILCNQPIELGSSNNFCILHFICAVHAYLLKYSSHLILPLETVCISYITAELANFEKFGKIIRQQICRLSESTDFPPHGFILNDEAARLILTFAQTAFRMRNCSAETFYNVIVSFLPCISSSLILNQFISSFWNETTASEIPINTIPLILSLTNDYNALFKLFVARLVKDSEELNKVISPFLQKSIRFRYWFVSDFLSKCAYYIPKAFSVARCLHLTSSEISEFIPALIKVLPKRNTATSIRAAGIKFVGTYQEFKQLKPLAKYCVQLAIYTLIRSQESPEFPLVEELLHGDSLTNTSLNLMTLENELSRYITSDNRNAVTKELNASLKLLTNAIECNSEMISEKEINTIHQILRRSDDIRVRKSYLKFLGALGLKGIAYASRLSNAIPVTPFF